MKIRISFCFIRIFDLIARFSARGFDDMTWEFEEKAWAQGYAAVCGVDEAGRGPVAGPVCAAAVILPGGIEIEVITENALAWSVSLVDEKTIDEINILQATYRAMRQAVEGLTRPADFAYVDGNRSEGLSLPHECVVAGDGKIPSVAAASIIAKVTRDRLMWQFAERYPEYGFEKHKGYETRAHDEALLAHGPCPIHRMTFLKKFYEKHPDAPR